jgi:hypothetical protein
VIQAFFGISIRNRSFWAGIKHAGNAYVFTAQCKRVSPDPRRNARYGFVSLPTTTVMSAPVSAYTCVSAIDDPGNDFWTASAAPSFLGSE